MGLLTFKGGIHPDDGKRFSKDSEIRTLLPKGELAVSYTHLLRKIMLL